MVRESFSTLCIADRQTGSFKVTLSLAGRHAGEGQCSSVAGGNSHYGKSLAESLKM